MAAVIGFHRGETDAARHRLAAAEPHAKWIGNRPISELALARSLDYEQAGALPKALATLTAGFANSTEDLGEMEDLLPDAVRLATQTGDLTPRRSSRITPPRSPPSRKSRTGRPTRCTAAACWTAMRPGCWRPHSVMTTPADRC